MSTIYGRYRYADDWIDKVHPQNGLFRVYWKDVKNPHYGGATLDPDEGEGLRYEWYYKNGQMVDKWFFYDKNGNLKEIRYFSPDF